LIGSHGSAAVSCLECPVLRVSLDQAKASIDQLLLNQQRATSSEKEALSRYGVLRALI